MTVTEVTSLQQFREIISKDKVSVFDFWAPWCGPCRVIGPKFENHSKDSLYGSVDFYKVNVDDNEDISREVGIRAMPTFISFKGGVKLETLVGADEGKLQTLVATSANK